MAEWLSRKAGSRYAGMAKEMFFVYVLKSEVNGRYYIGHTEFIDQRLIRHNSGLVKSTKSGRPWVCVYKESYSTRSEAFKRELAIKAYKGGIKFKKLLGLWNEKLEGWPSG